MAKRHLLFDNSQFTIWLGMPTGDNPDNAELFYAEGNFMQH